MLNFNDDADSHQKTEDRDWRESYYCNFLDPNSDLCGVAWQGARPNAGHGEAVFLLCDGDKEIVRSVDVRQPVGLTKQPGRKMNAQEFKCIEPWRRWKVEFRQPTANVDVDWTQMSDICDWEWEDLTGSKHFQAAGRVAVTGNVNGRSIAFSGFGERDRAWGPRNYGPLSFSIWMTAQFPDEVAVHALTLIDGSGAFRLYGYLHKEGRTRVLARCEATFAYEGDRGPPISGTFAFVDTDGRRLEIDSFNLINFLGLGGTRDDGAQLMPDPTKGDNIMYLTLQRFHRRDGVNGRGMIDLNCWVGHQRSSYESATPPMYTTLYPYGRTGA